MARTKIELPPAFTFKTIIPIRITDVNYGNHVGNDSILSIIHEARMQYLKNLGLSELEFAGVGLIMADVSIEFKNEAFYGDLIEASVTSGNLTNTGFELFYKLEKKSGEGTVLVAVARTGMVCFDYERKRIVSFPVNAVQLLKS